MKEEDADVVAEVRTFVTRFQVQSDPCAFARTAACADAGMAVFIAHGPAREMANDAHVGELLRVLDEDECVEAMHEHVRTHTCTWAMLRRAAARRDYSNERHWVDEVSLSLLRRDTEDRASRGDLLALADLLRIDREARFRLENGANAVLLLLSDGNDAKEHAHGCNVLMRCLDATPDLVVHAPALAKVMDVLVDDGVPLPFAPRLARKAGTPLLLALLRLGAEPKRLAQVFGPDLVALWPRRFGEAAAEWPPTTHCCRLTHKACVDPVVASDGHTYERDAILPVLLRHGPSPVTGEALDDRLVANRA
jgi:hypothetical protein